MSLCSKQTGSSSTKGNHHPSLFLFPIGQETSMQPKFVAAQKMLLKTGNPANICKWIALPYYLALHLLEARGYCH